jgi:gamma-glutamyl:cysteine ligase YbdK (ATP-grasp superfamily)
MGEEIKKSSFTDEDFEEFDERLNTETNMLQNWFSNNKFSDKDKVGGLEIEACLIDENCTPQPRNIEYLENLNDPMVVHELSAFNIEINCEPKEIKTNALRVFEEALLQTWGKAQAAANDMGLSLIMTGILPTLKDSMMVIDNMSPLKRYEAMNKQVLHLRKNKPIKLHITGNETLESEHNDVMLEATATAFQIHLQVPQGRAARFYNASKIISAPLVALGANSPFLFGKDLWAETRIPLFEQSVSVGKWDYAERVTFGVRYLEEGLFGAFKANQQRYPVIMPSTFDDEPEHMRHVKLHNGTIWRWNRPILGKDEDGSPHLRIEQRVLPSGPTIVDMIANMAFYYGLVYWLVENEADIEKEIPFYKSRDNFYEAAQNGMDAEIIWKGRKAVPLQQLVLEDLLPKARKGLETLMIDQGDIDKYLSIIEERAKSKQTGAEWQRQFIAKNGHDMKELCRTYLTNQETNEPVHSWAI